MHCRLLILLLFSYISSFAQQKNTNDLVVEAISLFDKNDYAGSIQLLDKVLQVDPHHEDALNYRSNAFNGLKNYAAALKDAKVLVTIKPSKAVYWNNAGWYALLTAAYDSARVYCTRAIELNPFDYNNYLNLGHAYAFLENPKKSLYYYHYAADYLPINELYKNGPIADLALFKSMKTYPYDTTSIAAMFRQTFEVFRSNDIANYILDSIYTLSFDHTWSDPLMQDLQRRFIAAEEKNQYWRYSILSRFNWQLGIVEYENKNTVKALNLHIHRSFALMNQMKDTVAMIQRLLQSAGFIKEGVESNLKWAINLSILSGEEKYLAAAYRELSDHYSEKYKWDSCLHYTKLLHAQAKYLYDEHVAPSFLLEATSRLSNCFSVFKLHDSALYYHRLSKLLLKERHHSESELYNLELDYVVLLGKAGQFEKSNQYAKNLLVEYRDASLRLDLSSLHSHIGMNYYALGNFKEAESFFMNAIAAYKVYAKDKIGSGYRIMNLRHELLFEQLKEIVRSQGNPEKMFAISEESKSNILYTGLSHSIFPKKIKTLREVQSTLKDDEAVMSFSSSGSLRYGYGVAFNKTSSATMLETEKLFDEKTTHPIMAKLVKLVTDFGARINPEYKKRPLELKEATMIFLPLFHVGDMGKVKTISRGSIEEEGSDDDQAEVSKVMNDFFYEIYVQPFEAILKGKKKIYISGELATAYLPFEAIQNKQGQFMGELYNIVHVPSFTIHALLHQKAGNNSGKFMAIGNPQYSKFNAAEMNGRAFDLAELGAKNWGDLPGTKQELDMLRKEIPGLKVIEDAMVSESIIREADNRGELKQYEVIHFALHGMTRIGVPDDISIILTEPKGTSYDGFLQFWEIAQMDLNAKLVCISACATATGTPHQGTEDMNIATALIMAGARSVLAAAWSIDDAATALFMKEFYHQQFSMGKSISEALHITRLKFITGEFGEQYKSPYYWAAFKLTGAD